MVRMRRRIHGLYEEEDTSYEPRLVFLRSQ
jgi:hypothetical protein